MSTPWNRLLPGTARLWLEGRPHLKDVIGNTAWLFADRVLRIAVGMLVALWVARYLGPTQFGGLNYALAFAALFSAFANLGLDSIVIRNIVREPACADETLGTAFALKLFGGFVTLALSALAIHLARPAGDPARALVVIIAAGNIFQAFDTIDFWFQSQVRSKFTVSARNAAFLLVSLVKIALILAKAPLLAFVWAAAGEIVLGAYGLIVAYRLAGHTLNGWRFALPRARELLGQSWPLFLSAAFVTLYIRIDQVMIGQMLGDRDVGIYSAAARLTEAWYFIPLAITSSVFPAVVSAKQQGEARYYQRLEQLFLLMVWLAVAVAIPTMLLARPLVRILFGEEYRGAATVLAIQCWSGLFIFSGLVSNQWYLLENLNHYTLYRHILGAALNVGLNLLLIPRAGIKGAAIATLATQFLSSYLFDALHRRTWAVFRIKSRCFFLFIPMTARAVREILAAQRSARLRESE